jgi:TonB family protein
MEGRVDSVELERSSGHALLDSLATSGAHELTYHPARRGDEPVGIWALLPVRFSRSAAARE